MENKNKPTKKQNSDKLLLNMEIFIGAISVICFLILLIVAVYTMYSLNELVFPIILICIAVLILVLGCTACIYIEKNAGFYMCKKCGAKHALTFWQVLIAPHIGRTRYTKCPNCRQRSWQKKTLN